jgi:hypothetical protein
MGPPHAHPAPATANPAGFNPGPADILLGPVGAETAAMPQLRAVFQTRVLPLAGPVRENLRVVSVRRVPGTFFLCIRFGTQSQSEAFLEAWSTRAWPDRDPHAGWYEELIQLAYHHAEQQGAGGGAADMYAALMGGAAGAPGGW